MRKTIIYLSNAIDDKCRVGRNITTDSPAATNKVFAIAKSLESADVRCIILSLGRGRQNDSGDWHYAFCRRNKGIIFLYCDFFHFPFLTHIVSIVSLAILLIKLALRKPSLKILVYNRTPHYILALAYARIFGIRAFLDLEDGYLTKRRSLNNIFMRLTYSYLCPSGAMVANSSLVKQLPFPPSLICYGVANDLNFPDRNWQFAKLRILFGGTLLEEAGSNLLLSAIHLLRKNSPELLHHVHFVVTGKGPYINQFHDLAKIAPDWLTINESLNRDAYVDLISKCHIGLNLRLSSFEMSVTTFPSKVIEYAENGLAIVSTRVGDVPILFGDDIIYLDEETPDGLAKLLLALPNTRAELSRISDVGKRKVLDVCNPIAVSSSILSMMEP